MNIFEFARVKEKQAEDIYQKLADTAFSEGIRSIFLKLAEAENKHFSILLKMEEAEKVEVSNSDILYYAKETLLKMKTREEKFKAATSQTQIYQSALAQEAESEKFYREHSEKASDSRQKNIFLILAQEEHHHYSTLENIIDFLTFPATHPEDAEFRTPEE